MDIAFDAATDGGASTGTSLSFNHTVTGSDPLLIVCFHGDYSNGNDDITSVTFAGIPMILAKKKIDPSYWRCAYVYLLPACPTGTHAVQIDCANSHLLIPVAASYTGCQASGQPDYVYAFAPASGLSPYATGDDFTLSNCWMILCAFGSQDTNHAGGTSRIQGSSFGTPTILDSNGVIPTFYEMSTNSLVANWRDGHIMLTLASAGGGVRTLITGDAFVEVVGIAPLLPQNYMPGVRAMTQTTHAPKLPVMLIPGVRAMTQTRYIPYIGQAEKPVPWINPFISMHVPQLWRSLLPEFGRALDYWPGGDQNQAAAVTLVWIEGTEDEEISPGRYSHALVENSALPALPALGDALDKDGSIFDVVRINAFAYYFSELVLKERTALVPVRRPWR